MCVGERLESPPWSSIWCSNLQRMRRSHRLVLPCSWTERDNRTNRLIRPLCNEHKCAAYTWSPTLKYIGSLCSSLWKFSKTNVLMSANTGGQLLNRFSTKNTKSRSDHMQAPGSIVLIIFSESIRRREQAIGSYSFWRYQLLFLSFPRRLRPLA